MLVPNVTLDGFLRASDVVAPGVWAVEGPLLVASLMKLSQLAVGEVSTTYLAVQLVALQMNVVAPGLRKNVPVVVNLIVQFWTDSMGGISDERSRESSPVTKLVVSKFI